MELIKIDNYKLARMSSLKNIIDMKLKVKIFFTVFILSLIVCIIITPLRSGSESITIGVLTGFYLSSVVGAIVYYTLTTCALHRYNTKLSPIIIITAIFLGQSILRLPFHIIDFDRTSNSFLEYLIQVFSIALGYIVYLCKSIKIKVIVSILGIIFGLWLSYPGYKMWLNKLSYGTFTGRLDDSEEIYNFQFQTTLGDTISLRDFRDKYLLIDHWYTYCGVCYSEFPKVQEVYDKYKDNLNVSIISIHSRLEDKNENYSTGKNILEDNGYSFPCYSIDIEAPILEDLGVKAYPTVLIFDPESKLVFRGSIDFAEKYLKKALKE